MPFTLRVRTILLTGLLLVTACQHVNQQHIQQQGDDAFAPVSSGRTIAHNSTQSTLLAELLLAELALQQQKDNEAYARYRALAEQTQSPQAYSVAYALALRAQQYKQAYTLANHWVEVDSDNIRAHRARALSALEQGEIDVVIQTLAHLEATEGKAPDGQFIALYNQYQIEPNIALVRGIMEQPEKNARTQLWALFLGSKTVSRMLENGELAQAEQLLQDLLIYGKTQKTDRFYSLTQRYTEQLYIQQLHLQVRTNSLALPVFAQHVKQHPQYHRLRYQLAEQYSLFLHADDEKRTYSQLRILLKEDTRTPLAVYRQALLLAAQLQMPLDFDTLLARLPHKTQEERAEKARLHALLLLSQYQFDNALALLQALFNQGYRRATLPNIVDALYQKGDTEHAYQTTLLINQDSDVNNVLLKANLLHDTARHTESNDTITTWLAKANMQAHAQGRKQLYVLQASNQFFLGEITQMIAAIDTRIDQHPTDDMLLNSFGFMMTEAGTQLARARGMIKDALIQQPANAAYIDSLGWVEHKLGNFKEAERLLTISYRLLPNAETGAHLAAVYQALDQEAKAHNLYRRIWLTDRNSRFLPQDFAPKHSK